METTTYSADDWAATLLREAYVYKLRPLNKEFPTKISDTVLDMLPLATRAMLQYGFYVIDGDSVKCFCDKGDRQYYKAICRIDGIDTPEKGTVAGQLVKQVVWEWCLDRPEAIVPVSTEKPKFAGRFVGNIVDSSCGVTLSSYLLNTGLSKPYQGGRREWTDDELDAIEAIARKILGE